MVGDEARERRVHRQCGYARIPYGFFRFEILVLPGGFSPMVTMLAAGKILATELSYHLYDVGLSASSATRMSSSFGRLQRASRSC